MTEAEQLIVELVTDFFHKTKDEEKKLLAIEALESVFFNDEAEQLKTEMI